MKKDRKKNTAPASMSPDSVENLIQMVEAERNQLKDRLRHLDTVSEYLNSFLQKKKWEDAALDIIEIRSGGQFDGLSIAEAARRVLLESGKMYLSTQQIYEKLRANRYRTDKKPDRLRTALTVTLHRRKGVFKKHATKRATWKLIQTDEQRKAAADK